MTTTYTCGPGFGTRGQMAYELRAQGLSWAAIADQLQPPSSGCPAGNPQSAMCNVAKKHAILHDLPWPLHRVAPPAAPSVATVTTPQQQVAYELRLSGLRWLEVARSAGYKHAAHAITGASKHASRHGLPWPIRTGDGS